MLIGAHSVLFGSNPFVRTPLTPPPPPPHYHTTFLTSPLVSLLAVEQPSRYCLFTQADKKGCGFKEDNVIKRWPIQLMLDTDAELIII
jgi:hypothetical protein